MPAKLTINDFIRKANAVHGSRYDYAPTRYSSNEDMLTIRCKEHGEFVQRARNHLLGRGCPRCKAEQTSIRQSGSREDFIAKARAIHGGRYDYTKVEYTRSSRKVEIICPQHGSFMVSPNSHLSRKTGCPKCAGKGFSNAEFVAMLREKHGLTYQYDQVVYDGIKNKITVACPKHGSFEQTAEAHRLGQGCPQCGHEARASQAERELAEWLDGQGIPFVHCDRSLLDGSEIDFLFPQAGIGVELNGRYWHSDKIKHPRFHERKTAAAQEKGVRLITVWDFDWAARRPIVERLILNAVHADHAEKIGARQCTIAEVDNVDAATFYAANHLQGSCRGSLLNLALTHQGRIVACMSFTKGGTRRGKAGSGEYELARYATSITVPGGATRLFSRFVAMRQPTIVWSFSDKQSFSGKLYETLGFSRDGELRADYRIACPRTMQTWHKSLWQRKSLQRRITELGLGMSFDHRTDPRTERQMIDALGMLRVWDSGKVRWVWRDHSST